MAITAKEIKELRDATAAGMLACREALTESGGDFDKAVDYLREKGLAKAAKRADRDASDGVVEVYSHGGGRVGVMVEVNCETDFVSNTEDFKTFAHEIALQIAAAAPLFITEDEVPQEYLEREAEVARNRAKEEGKPEKIFDKIVEGRIEKYKDEIVLLRQSYIRDESKTIHDLLNEKIVAIGENILIRRFQRYELGEMAGDQSAES